jgi:hypothetical protein
MVLVCIGFDVVLEHQATQRSSKLCAVAMVAIFLFFLAKSENSNSNKSTRSLFAFCLQCARTRARNAPAALDTSARFFAFFAC